MLTYPTNYDEKQKIQLRKNSTQYFVKNHTLYRRNKKGNLRVIVQDQVKPNLFHIHRDITEAYLKIDAVFEKVKKRYYWPQMFNNIRNYMRTCNVCQRK